MADLSVLRPDATRATEADDAMHAHLAGRLTGLAAAMEDQAPDLAAGLTGLATQVSSGRRVPSMAFALCDRLASDVADPRVLAGRLVALPPRTLRRPLLIAGAADAAPLLSMLACDTDPALAQSPVASSEASAFAVRLAQASVLMGAHLPELRAESDILFQEILLGHAPSGHPARTGCGPHERYWGLLIIDPARNATPVALVDTLARETAQAVMCGLAIGDRLSAGPVDASAAEAPFRAALAAARAAWAMDRIADARDVSDADREAATGAGRRAHADFADRLNALRGLKGATGQAGAVDALLAETEAWISA